MKDIQILVVWIKMYEADLMEAAQRAAEQLGSAPRIMHFYDPDQRLGKEVAKGLGAESGEVAWDIYLFYDRGSRWVDRIPMPLDWAHQLSGSRWADPTRLYRGEALSRRLQEMVAGLT